MPRLPAEAQLQSEHAIAPDCPLAIPYRRSSALPTGVRSRSARNVDKWAKSWEIELLPSPDIGLRFQVDLRSVQRRGARLRFGGGLC